MILLIFVPKAAAQPQYSAQPQVGTVALIQNAIKPPAQPAPFSAELSRLKAWQAANPPPPVVVAPPAPVVAYTPPPAVSDPLMFIFDHESGNNPGAINASSGACGLGQALPCSKMPCSLSDYACQVNFFTQYALDRYGSVYNAYLFWIQNKWW